MMVPGRGIARTSVATAATATAATVAVTLGLAVGCWVLAIRRMSGMDMGSATGLGSFGFFMGAWAAMMAAMMLPGATPVIARRAAGTRSSGLVRPVVIFTGSY